METSAIAIVLAPGSARFLLGLMLTLLSSRMSTLAEVSGSASSGATLLEPARLGTYFGNLLVFQGAMVTLLAF